VDTFNEMIARLEMSIKKIRQFSGDVSHELRTPLTIIRGEIEVLQRKDRTSEEYRQMMISVLEETARMNKIIDDLLFLSRLEALAKIDFAGPVLLDEVLVRSFESRSFRPDARASPWSAGTPCPSASAAKRISSNV
jgi:signal transduction histidine kinase